MARTRDERRRVAAEDATAPGVAANIGLIAGLIALAALALFLVQNLQEVQVHFLWFDWSTRMFWALLASGVSGALTAVLVGALNRRRRR